MDLIDIIKERKSIRAFKPDEVPKETITEIIKLATKAPSAINLQPWEFYVVYGEEKVRLGRTLLKAYHEKRISCGPGTDKPLPSVFRNRGTQGTEAMKPYLSDMGVSFDQFVNEGSCNFYGAPVAIIICLDDCFPKYNNLDIGIVLGYLLLIAHSFKLATCPIGLITAYEDEIKELLNIPENKRVVIGVALGYEDTLSPINQYKSTRDVIDNMVKWID